MHDKTSPTYPSEAAVNSLSKPLLHMILIALAGLLAYGNSFQVPFHLDDYRSMLELPFVRDLSYLTDWREAQQHAMEYGFRGRFIGYLSFALNFAAGEANVFGYHVVNFCIHIANAFLVYLLIVNILPLVSEEPVFAGKPPAATGFVALLAALLFVVHPVQTGAVTYIVQRFASLATLFYLLCFFGYLKAQRGDADGRRLWYGAAVISAVLAMETKEIAFTLPAMLCLFDFMFLSGTAARRALRLSPFLVTMLIIPLNLLVRPGTDATLGKVGEATTVMTTLSRGDYFLTELRVVMTYLRLLVFPAGQNLLYDYPVFHSLLNPEVALSLLFILLLVGLAIWCARRGQRGEPLLKVVSFGIFWFFVTLSVESSVIPIADVIFEHRLYLPSVGAFIAVATWLPFAFRLVPTVPDGALYALAGAVILVLGSATFARNEVWQSEENLWRDVVGKSPGRSEAHQGLGSALREKGDIAGAFRSFETAIALDPQSADAVANRGTLYAETGRMDKAVEDFARAVELDPNSPAAWCNLGLACSELGDHARAAEALSRAISLNPYLPSSYNNLGLVLVRQGRLDEAIAKYDKAVALAPLYAKAYFNRGVALTERGRADRGIPDLSRALELDPSLIQAYTWRGKALARMGEREGAARDFQLGCSYRDTEACDQLERMLRR